MSKPAPYLRITEEHPELIEAYERFASIAHESGPLSDRERRLVKLAIAIATHSEGATHSHVRQGLAAGLSADDLQHVAFVAATTAGFPTTMRAITWIQDITDGG